MGVGSIDDVGSMDVFKDVDILNDVDMVGSWDILCEGLIDTVGYIGLLIELLCDGCIDDEVDVLVEILGI